jgi:hypothetical protein
MKVHMNEHQPDSWREKILSGMYHDLLSAHVSAHFRVISGGGPGILGYLGGASSIKARV